jgi:hypothetical protein
MSFEFFTNDAFVCKGPPQGGCQFTLNPKKEKQTFIKKDVSPHHVLFALNIILEH